jgi:hypothetical protein
MIQNEVANYELSKQLFDAGVRIKTMCWWDGGGSLYLQLHPILVARVDIATGGVVSLNTIPNGLNVIPAPTFTELWGVMPPMKEISVACYRLNLEKREPGAPNAGTLSRYGGFLLRGILDFTADTPANALIKTCLAGIKEGYIKIEDLN